MSLDLSELVSVTNSAVRSLEKSQSSSGSDKNKPFNFDSPFESPRSLRSLSATNDAQSHGIDSGIGKSAVATVSSKADKTCAGKSKPNVDEMKENNNNNANSRPASAKHDPSPADITHDESSNDISKMDLGTRSSLEQDVSLLDTTKSKDLSVGNRQETTTSDNNLASSLGSKMSEKELEPSAPDSDPRQHRTVHVSVSRERHPRRLPFQRDQNAADSGDHSNEDPEIIDVPERIIAVKSGLSSGSEDDSTFNEIDTVVEANLPQNRSDKFFGLKSFGKAVNAQSGPLKQGALSKGILDPLETAQHGDVYISQFGLTERQRGLKEALARRADNSYPKKKVVQPKLISVQRQSDADSDLDSALSKPGQPTGADPAVTAAVAASAAVAATQPFLKAQQELEQRMQQFLTQLAEIQGKDPSSLAQQQQTAKPPQTDGRLEDLERQVAELNERRMEHLENLQQQQMQMQAQLLFMSRTRNHQSRPVGRIPQAVGSNLNVNSSSNFNNLHHASQQVAGTRGNSNNHGYFTSPTRSDVRPAPSASTYFGTNANLGGSTGGKRGGPGGQPLFNPETLSSHFNYLNEVRELQGSHLDTPAPREKVPKPTPYSLPQPHSQKSLGFLEELLAQREDPEKDTTFSVREGHSPPTKLQRDSLQALR